MKKYFKKLFFGIFLMVITFVSAISVNALTIRETTTATDSFDTITDGTIVMGITKFQPNVVITALRASKATFNDVTFHYGTPEYNGVEIFYLLSGEWYNIDDDNNAILVEDAEKIAGLNSTDIYFINNNEKILEIPYPKELGEGYKFVFYTNDVTKNDKIVLENGKIKVPATIQNVEVFVKNTQNNTEEKLDVFEKANLNDNKFNKTSSDGTIAKGDSTGGELTYTPVGSKITINGTIDWYKADAAVQNGRISGNYASVKITAPEVYDKNELLTNASVKIDNREAVNWDTITDDTLGEDTFFVYYPRFDSETTSHTITIEWVDGNTQVFTIELDQNATLEKAALGTIERDPGFTGGNDLDVNVVGSKITFNGAIDWYKGDTTLGRTAGNMVGVKITAPSEYKASEIESAVVTIDTKAPYVWKDILDGENYFYYYPTLTAENRTSTVTIKWEKGNTQVFTIELDQNATLEKAALGTITKGDSTGGELTYTPVGNKITINGAIEWYNADALAQNGRISGNYASVKITAPEVYTEIELLANATVKIDNREAVNWDTITDDTLGEDTFFVYYPRFDSETKSHTVTIEWENGNIQIFTIELDQGATLDDNEEEK